MPAPILGLSGIRCGFSTQLTYKQLKLTKGVQDNLRHMKMNKQGTFSCRNVLLLHERHQSSHDRGSVASQQVTRMFSPKNPDDSLKAHACSPYTPPTLCISIMFVMSWSSASLFWQEITAHAQESCAGSPAHPPASPPTVFYSYAWTISSIPYPRFQACDTLPQVFWCALILEPKILKTC